MLNNFFTATVLVLVLVIVQISFLPTWPMPVSMVNVVLCVLIFLAIHGRYSYALGAAFASGLLLEIYAPYPFGVVTISLLVTLMCVHSFTTSIFTNRSLYSLVIIGLLSTLLYITVRELAEWLLQAIEPTLLQSPFFSWSAVRVIGWQLVLHPIILASLYAAFRTFSRSGRSSFHQIGELR